MGGYGEIRLKPSQIRFSQNSVFFKFYGRSKTLNEEVNAFISSWTSSSVDDYPTMRTVIKDRKIYSLDNRRLYLFRALERRGHATDVPVTLRAYSSLDSRKFTTRNDGETITFSGMRRRSISDPSPVEHDSREGTSRDIEDMDMNASTREKVSSILKEIAEEEERERKALEEEEEKTTPVESDEEPTSNESSGYEYIVIAATKEEVLVNETEEDTVEFPQQMEFFFPEAEAEATEAEAIVKNAESVLAAVELPEKDEGIISAITGEYPLVQEPSEDGSAMVEPMKSFLHEDEEVVSSRIWSFGIGLFQNRDACLEKVDHCQETESALATESVIDTPMSESYKSSVANAAEQYQSSSEQLDPMRILQNTNSEELSNQLKRSHDSLDNSGTEDNEGIDTKILRLSNEIDPETVLMHSGASEPYSDLSEATAVKILHKQESEEHVNPLKRTHDAAIESKTDEVEEVDQELSENKVIEDNGPGHENNFTDGEEPRRKFILIEI